MDIIFFMDINPESLRLVTQVAPESEASATHAGFQSVPWFRILQAPFGRTLCLLFPWYYISLYLNRSF